MNKISKYTKYKNAAKYEHILSNFHVSQLFCLVQNLKNWKYSKQFVHFLSVCVRVSVCACKCGY